MAESQGGHPRAVLRVGRKVGRTIYQQVAATPSDSDCLVGLMDSPALAAAVVAAVNAAWELTDYFENELAVDPSDSQAEWALSLLRPIWKDGLGPPGG